jgi:hypothetical protein
MKKHTSGDGPPLGRKADPPKPKSQIDAAVSNWLDGQIAKSDEEVRLGPHCLGWESNESKRGEIEALNRFLHAMRKLQHQS